MTSLGNCIKAGKCLMMEALEAKTLWCWRAVRMLGRAGKAEAETDVDGDEDEDEMPLQLLWTECCKLTMVVEVDILMVSCL